MCDVVWFWSVGYVFGVLFDNIVVFDEEWLFNIEGFCYVDECVCYKVLDVIGDLLLVGLLLLGVYCFVCGGYKFNYVVLIVLFVDWIVWCVVEGEVVCCLICLVVEIGCGIVGGWVVVVFGLDVF